MGKIVSKHIRESARGEACTLNIARVCNYNNETTVLAHLPDESNGMGTKADDISACYACGDCHQLIDSPGDPRLTSEDREWYMRRAMVRTWRRLLEKGIVGIKGVKL